MILEVFSLDLQGVISMGAFNWARTGLIATCNDCVYII